MTKTFEDLDKHLLEPNWLDLSGLSLIDKSYIGFDFSNLVLCNSSYKNSKLYFWGGEVTLTDAKFSNCALDVILEGSHNKGVKLSSCTINDKSSFTNVNSQNMVCEQCNINGVMAIDSSFKSGVFEHCNISDLYSNNSIFQEAKIKECAIEDLDFKNCDCGDILFENCNIKNTVFSLCKMNKAKFNGITFSGDVKFYKCDLSYCDFSNINFKGEVILEDCTIDNGDFSGVDIKHFTLQGTKNGKVKI